MEDYFGNAVASMPQSRDRLENRGGQDDKVSRRVWEVVEASIREVGIGETKGRRGKGGRGEKEREKEEEKETEKGKNSGSKESSGGMGNMG